MLPVSVITASHPEPQARIEISIGSLSVRLTAESEPSVTVRASMARV